MRAVTVRASPEISTPLSCDRSSKKTQNGSIYNGKFGLYSSCNRQHCCYSHHQPNCAFSAVEKAQIRVIDRSSADRRDHDQCNDGAHSVCVSFPVCLS